MAVCSRIINQAIQPSNSPLPRSFTEPDCLLVYSQDVAAAESFSWPDKRNHTVFPIPFRKVLVSTPRCPTITLCCFTYGETAPGSS